MSGSTFVELSELTKSCWWGKRDVGGMESSSAVGARDQAEAKREGEGRIQACAQRTVIFFSSCSMSAI